MVFKVLIPVMSKEERRKNLKPPEGSKKRGKETPMREEAGKKMIMIETERQEGLVYLEPAEEPGVGNDLSK